jgi:serine/threonine protein kinase
MYHLAALEPPFESDNIETLKRLIQSSSPKPLTGCYSVKFKEFVFKMLEKQKSKRPYIQEIIDMFPKSFSLIRPIDISNYDSLKHKELKTARLEKVNIMSEEVDEYL